MPTTSIMLHHPLLLLLLIAIRVLVKEEGECPILSRQSRGMLQWNEVRHLHPRSGGVPLKKKFLLVILLSSPWIPEDHWRINQHRPTVPSRLLINWHWPAVGIRQKPSGPQRPPISRILLQQQHLLCQFQNRWFPPPLPLLRRLLVHPPGGIIGGV